MSKLFDCVRGLVILLALTVVLFLSAGIAEAESGAVSRVETTKYSTLNIVGAVLGGIICLAGAYLALRRRAGDPQATATVKAGKERSLHLGNVSQGVVVVLIGAIVILGSLFVLPREKTLEVRASGEGLEIDAHGGVTAD